MSRQLFGWVAGALGNSAGLVKGLQAVPSGLKPVRRELML